MEEKKTRDVTEALELFDRLTDEQKKKVLDLWKTQSIVCKVNKMAV